MRLRIDLSYDGARFHGWATQPGLRTVQEELEKALDTVLRTTGSSLTVAGRTDTGVHARGQVAHVDVAPELVKAASGRSRQTPPEALARRLNGVVGTDLRIRSISDAPAGFDARFSAIWRRYVYRVADRPDLVDPLTRGHVLVWSNELDLDTMNQASQDLLGEQDFAAFCRKRAGATTIRSLLDLHWNRDEAGVAVATVRADAFCHHMVRSLVGCLIAVGEGRQPIGWPRQVLTARQRISSVKVARAHGLTLEEVRYPADSELATRASEARVLRTLTPPSDQSGG